MKTIKIIQEGVFDEQVGRIILPGALTWDDGPILATRYISEDVIGHVHNLRREDNWIVGDADFEFEDDLYSPAGLVTKMSYSLEVNGVSEITSGTLTFVLLAQLLGYPKTTNN